MGNPNKIVIIGNAAGGKTLLSQRLGEARNLPVFHIDSFQFLPGMKIRPLEQTKTWIRDITQKDKWIIDGYGPLDILEERLKLAEQIIYLDWPLPYHFFWAAKRSLANLLWPRPELPAGCSENDMTHIKKLFRTIWKIHTQMRPQIYRLLSRPQYQEKVLVIRTRANWNVVFQKSQHLKDRGP